MNKEEEKAIVDAVFDCSEKRKTEGAKIRSFLLQYKDIIKPNFYNAQIIQEINNLDFNLKNENLMLEQLVDKLEKFNTDVYNKNWILDQLKDATQRLVKVNHIKEYLESVKSSLDLNKDVIDQSVVAKYEDYKFQIDQTRETLVELNKTIRRNNAELEKIEKDIEKLKTDEAIDLEADSSYTARFSEETQKKIDQLKSNNELLKKSEKKTSESLVASNVSSKRNILLHDFNYTKNEEIIGETIEKTKLNSLVSFFGIEVEIEKVVRGGYVEPSIVKYLNVTKTLEARIKAKELNETTVNLFIVILEEDYEKVSFKLDGLISRIRHDLNVLLICRSNVLNQIKLPPNRGTLKIKRETTENYTEWANIVQNKLNKQEKVEEAISNIPILKRDNNKLTITRLETVKDDQVTREEEEKQLKEKLEYDRLKKRELLLEHLQTRRKEIQSELDNMANVKVNKETSSKEKQKLLNDLEPERNAVLKKLKAQVDKEKTINPRLYQLESMLNPSIDYLIILCKRRGLLLNYIDKIKNYLMDQFANDGFQNQAFFPSYINNIIGFLRLKPFSE